MATIDDRFDKLAEISRELLELIKSSNQRLDGQDERLANSERMLAVQNERLANSEKMLEENSRLMRAHQKMLGEHERAVGDNKQMLSELKTNGEKLSGILEETRNDLRYTKRIWVGMAKHFGWDWLDDGDLA